MSEEMPVYICILVCLFDWISIMIFLMRIDVISCVLVFGVDGMIGVLNILAGKRKLKIRLYVNAWLILMTLVVYERILADIEDIKMTICYLAFLTQFFSKISK